MDNLYLSLEQSDSVHESFWRVQEVKDGGANDFNHKKKGMALVQRNNKKEEQHIGTLYNVKNNVRGKIQSMLVLFPGDVDTPNMVQWKSEKTTTKETWSYPSGYYESPKEVIEKQKLKYLTLNTNKSKVVLSDKCTKANKDKWFEQLLHQNVDYEVRHNNTYPYYMKIQRNARLCIDHDLSVYIDIMIQEAMEDDEDNWKTIDMKKFKIREKPDWLSCPLGVTPEELRNPSTLQRIIFAAKPFESKYNNVNWFNKVDSLEIRADKLLPLTFELLVVLRMTYDNRTTSLLHNFNTYYNGWYKQRTKHPTPTIEPPKTEIRGGNTEDVFSDANREIYNNKLNQLQTQWKKHKEQQKTMKITDTDSVHREDNEFVSTSKIIVTDINEFMNTLMHKLQNFEFVIRENELIRVTMKYVHQKKQIRENIIQLTKGTLFRDFCERHTTLPVAVKTTKYTIHQVEAKNTHWKKMNGRKNTMRNDQVDHMFKKMEHDMTATIHCKNMFQSEDVMHCMLEGEDDTKTKRWTSHFIINDSFRVFELIDGSQDGNSEPVDAEDVAKIDHIEIRTQETPNGTIIIFKTSPEPAEEDAYTRALTHSIDEFCGGKQYYPHYIFYNINPWIAFRPGNVTDSIILPVTQDPLKKDRAVMEIQKSQNLRNSYLPLDMRNIGFKMLPPDDTDETSGPKHRNNPQKLDKRYLCHTLKHALEACGFTFCPLSPGAGAGQVRLR